ncbi:flagellar biosynthetic protein FliO [Halorhodospira halochloris]|uniref:flagellar biosynthetic protein FliO n=1 Tax=Halorhodospira halochloris TaxID=1052 RepID=UPI001EE7A213|nr:flagellar biosynthetic protein FliO [Halorhodospira halochloris]MCG5529986.1 flagellar biosynthetic protein FliO [Halorhodospira halochloris]MCG5548259.1 flagellar biosynthetic protein FliO [Halorhodospira halochloris]
MIDIVPLRGSCHSTLQRFAAKSAKLARPLAVSCLLFCYSHLAWADQDRVPGVEAEAIARVIVVLVIIVVLIVALAWGLRRFSGLSSTASGQMRVLGSLPVGNRERVVLVKVGEEQILLGVAPGSVRFLQVLDKPVVDDTAPGAAQAGPFAARLRSMMQHQSKQQ